MVSRKLAVTGAAVACVACCAPLIVPLVWPVLIAAGIGGAGAAGGGWLAGISTDLVICGALGIAALAGTLMWLRQRRKRALVPPPVFTEGASCALDTCGPPDRNALKSHGND